MRSRCFCRPLWARAPVVSIAVALVVLITFCGVRAAEEGVDESLKQDYSSVKEDFLCRACVALSTTFFDDVLQPTAEQYVRLVETLKKQTGGGDSALKGLRKESMVADVHTAIDGLCKEVERTQSLLLEDGEADAPDAGKESKKVVPGGSKKTIYDGIRIACPHALGDLTDAFEETAFKLLLPHIEKYQRSQRTSDDSTADEKTKTDSEEIVYTLPKAGAFCEQHKMCSPYLHYHITSSAYVDRIRQAHRKKEAAAGKGARSNRETDDAKMRTESAYSDADRAAFEETKRRARAGAQAAKSSSASSTGTGDAGRSHGERTGPHGSEVHIIRQQAGEIAELLSHPVELLSNALRVVPWAEVLAPEFLQKQFRFLISDAVRFHMGPTLPYVAVAAVGLLFISFVLSVLLMCCGCMSCFTGGKDEEKRKGNGSGKPSSSSEKKNN